jgi:hypothetical protein
MTCSLANGGYFGRSVARQTNGRQRSGLDPWATYVMHRLVLASEGLAASELKSASIFPGAPGVREREASKARYRKQVQVKKFPRCFLRRGSK